MLIHSYFDHAFIQNKGLLKQISTSEEEKTQLEAEVGPVSCLFFHELGANVN